MMLFDRRRKSVSRDAVDYLFAEVDAAEAADVLGVTAARWRQIAGSRSEPNAALPQYVREGVRGARWKLRDVYTYAVMSERDVTTDLPPLLPLPVDERRPGYRPERYLRVPIPVLQARHGQARQGHELRCTAPGEAVSVWGELLAPTAPRRCGQPEQCLLLLTPLWPNDTYRAVRTLADYVQQAATLPGWGAALQQHPAGLSVVILHGGDDTAPTASVVFLTAEELHDLTQPSLASRADSFARRYVHHSVPAVDIAACLGWAGLPWWPTGTATRGLCARWIPGETLSTDVPEALRGRERATRWILRQQPSSPARAEDFAELARMYDPARQEGLHALLARQHDLGGADDSTRVPAGYELAVLPRWEPISPEAAPGGQPDRALDQIMADPTVPREIAEAMHQWLGDSTYAAPAYFPRDMIPDTWWDLLPQSLTPLPNRSLATSPRWQRLISTHLRESIDVDPSYNLEADNLIVATMGPLQAPVAYDDYGITIASPTGYDPASPIWKDQPHRALPDEPDEIRDVLLMTSPSGLLRGLYRTDRQQLAPMAAKGSWLTGLDGQSAALVGACTATPTEDVITLAQRSNLADREPAMTTLLQHPDVVSWSNLCDTAIRTLASYQSHERRHASPTS